MAGLIEEWDNFGGGCQGSAEKENMVVRFLEEQLDTLGIPTSEISILGVAAFTGMISISLYKHGFNYVTANEINGMFKKNSRRNSICYYIRTTLVTISSTWV